MMILCLRQRYTPPHTHPARAHPTPFRPGALSAVDLNNQGNGSCAGTGGALSLLSLVERVAARSLPTTETATSSSTPPYTSCEAERTCVRVCYILLQQQPTRRRAAALPCLSPPRRHTPPKPDGGHLFHTYHLVLLQRRRKLLFKRVSFHIHVLKYALVGCVHARRCQRRTGWKGR